MQTMAPPDEKSSERSARIDERFGRVDERFDETNRRITEGREETNRRFDKAQQETNRRFDEAKQETNLRFDRVEGDIRELKKSVAGIQESVVAIHATLTKIGFGVALTFVSVFLTRGF